MSIEKTQIRRDSLKGVSSRKIRQNQDLCTALYPRPKGRGFTAEMDKFKIMFKSKFFKRNIDDLEKQYRLKYIASLHNFDAGIKIHIPDWQNYYKKLN